MARYTGSVCRMCRREGTKLFLKGEKCFTAKCAMEHRQTPPGQHGQGRQRKMSEYGQQLREKQKARRAYGLMEGQFKRTFERATGLKGVTGDNLLRLLELRLDNFVYRSGFGSSRSQARQLVRHGHFTVNGKKVDIPSYTLSEGDVIAVRTRSKDIAIFKAQREGSARVIPKWITVDNENLSATLALVPTREDIDLSLQDNLIVEYYSR